MALDLPELTSYFIQIADVLLILPMFFILLLVKEYRISNRMIPLILNIISLFCIAVFYVIFMKAMVMPFISLIFTQKSAIKQALFFWPSLPDFLSITILVSELRTTFFHWRDALILLASICVAVYNGLRPANYQVIKAVREEKDKYLVYRIAKLVLWFFSALLFGCFILSVYYQTMMTNVRNTTFVLMYLFFGAVIFYYYINIHVAKDILKKTRKKHLIGLMISLPSILC